MLDDISQAVLEREEVLRYLRGDYGARGEQARERIYTYLEELRTTQRYPIYRALQHPLYPILRKIERKPENLHHVLNATRAHRVPAPKQKAPPRPRRGAPRARRQGRAPAAHRRRHQPVRRSARPAASA